MKDTSIKKDFKWYSVRRQLVLGIGSARFAALAGQGLGANLREAEYEKLQSYSFANIDHFRVSSIVTRLTSDVTNIQNAVSTGMRPFGRSPVMLIFASGLWHFPLIQHWRLYFSWHCRYLPCYSFALL